MFDWATCFVGYHNYIAPGKCPKKTSEQLSYILYFLQQEFSPNVLPNKANDHMTSVVSLEHNVLLALGFEGHYLRYPDFLFSAQVRLAREGWDKVAE